MASYSHHAFTDEQISFLRAQCKTEASYEEIRALFNTTFGTRLSRNSILGKCTRLGLREAKPRGWAPRKPRSREQRRVERQSGLNRQRLAALAASPAPSLVRDSGGDVALRVDDGRTNRLADAAMRNSNLARTPFAGVDSVFDGTCPNAKSFLDLRRGDCRWPADQNATLACGDPAKVGSYCVRHARIAYRAMPTVSRNERALAGAGYLDTQDDVSTDTVLTHMLESGGVQAPLAIPCFLPSKEDAA